MCPAACGAAKNDATTILQTPFVIMLCPAVQKCMITKEAEIAQAIALH